MPAGRVRFRRAATRKSRLRPIEVRASVPRTSAGRCRIVEQGEDVVPRLTRRSLVLAGAAAPFVAAPFVARAHMWPAPIRIIVPYPPGGSTDAMMRLVQPTLQQRLGATVIIE